MEIGVPAVQGRTWCPLLVLVILVCLLATSGQAATVPSSSTAAAAPPPAAEQTAFPLVTDTVSFTAATEQDAQAALNRHATSHVLLQLILRPDRSRSNSGGRAFKLAKGLLVPQGSGPVRIAPDDISSTGSSSNREQLLMDCSKLATTDTAAAIRIETQAAVEIWGLHITACNSTPAIAATDSGVLNLLGMKFTRNMNTAEDSSSLGLGTVSCQNCQRLTVRNSVFIGNTARLGGALSIRAAPGGMQLLNCTFKDNVGETDAGAVNAVNSPVHISGCSFEHERAVTQGAWGGAVYHSGAGLDIEHSRFTNCHSASNGGALAVFEAAASLTNVTCESTTADVFGGCLFAGFSNVTVRDSVFYNSTSYFVGGAMHLDRSSNLTAYNTTFHSNWAYYGGAINGQEESGSAALHGCLLENNTAIEKGGAVHAESQAFNFTATDTVFINNRVDKLGGGIACTTAACSFVNCTLQNNTADELGGGVWSSAAELLEFTSSSIADNQAPRGGGIYAEKTGTVLVASSTISNTADIDGGGLTLLSAKNATISGSIVQHNKAVVGAGIMLLATGRLQITNSMIANNAAEKVYNKAVVVTSDGTVANSGSGAGIWGIQSTLELSSAVFSSNQAERDGAGAFLLACPTSLIDSSFENNTAQTGNGGALSASLEAGLGISATRSKYVANKAGSGGAIYVAGATSGAGFGSLSCDGCSFQDNRASAEVPETAGGGGIMATGSVQLQLTNTQATNNAAPCGSGGAIQCLQFKTLVVRGTTAELNRAGKAGGAISCVQCGSTYLTGFTALNNTAATGGALSLSTTAQNASEATPGNMLGSSGIFDSRFISNSAHRQLKDCAGIGSGGTAKVAGGNSTAQPLSGAVVGAGGALAVENSTPFAISNSMFERNSAGMDGGAVLHRACKGVSSCTLSIQDATFTDNTAFHGGGGALYTTNGSLLLLGNAAGCQSGSSKQCTAPADIRSNGNTATYGADYTSRPSSLGLKTAEMEEVVGTAADARSVPESLQAYVGNHSGSGAQIVLYLSSNKEFNLTVSLLDLFGEQVLTARSAQQADVSLKLVDFTDASAAALENSSSGSSACIHPSSQAESGVGRSSTGPGSSLCAVAGWRADEQSSAASSAVVAANRGTCAVGCLTGATTVAFDRGYANFTNVGLSARPNSLLYMDIVPRGLDGISVTRVLVRVQPCGVGEVLQQDANGEARCGACPVPLINLSPGTSDTCGECPAGADCLSGFMVPQQGFWHSHPRSANFLPCPSRLSCAAADPGKLVAYQRALKYDVHPEQNVVAFRRYMQAQCAETRDGPLCSACAPGYALGPGNVCHRCVNHNRGAAFIAFLAVRLLDVALVLSLTLAIIFVWQFSMEFTPGCQNRAAPDSGCQLTPTMADGVSITATATPTGAATDAKDDVKDGMTKDKAVEEVATAALVNKSLVQLSLAVLVLLEWQQVGYLLFSMASPFMPRGASWLALLFLTPSSTLQWVPLGCVLPGVGGTAAAAVLSTLYPVLLAGVVSVCLICSKSVCRSRQGGRLDPISEQQQCQQQQQQYQQQQQPPKTPAEVEASLPECAKVLHRLYTYAAADLGTLGLLLLAATASLLYCVTDVTSAVASAFQCSALDAEPSEGAAVLPGDIRAAVGFWWSSDLRLPCFSALHIAVAVTVGLIGIPLILGTIALIVFASQRHAAAEQRVAAGRAQWHRIQQLRDDSAFSFTRSVLRLLSFKSAGNKAPPSGNSVQTLPEPISEAASGVQIALDMVGCFVCFPFPSYAQWWITLAMVWRIVIAAVVAVLRTAVGSSSVVMVGLAASALVALLQLLHAAFLPGSSLIKADLVLAGCYIGLQVMCLLLVAADAFTSSSVAAAGALYTLTTVVGIAAASYFVYLAMLALHNCLTSNSK